MLKGRLTALGSAVGLVALTGGAAGFSLATSQSAPTTSTPLAQVIAPAPSGFTSEPRIEQASPKLQTGEQTYSEATYPECDFALNTGDGKTWVASEVRDFDKDPKYASVYLTVCVTQLTSPTYAKTDESRDAEFLSEVLPSASFPAPEIPRGTEIVGNYSNTLVWVVFSKGPYLTVITTQGEKVEQTEAKELSVNWAIAEYHLLPT